MAYDLSKVKPIKPNYIFRLSFTEYFKKLTALKLYKSQMSFKKEPLHKIYLLPKMINEFFYVNSILKINYFLLLAQ